MKKSVVATIVAAFLGSSVVYAEGLPEGLTIRPYEEISFSDNVFLAPHGEENGSGINRTGLQLGYVRNRGDVNFDIKGKVEDVRYWRFSGLDYVGYSVTPVMMYDPGRWRLTLGGEFSYDLTPVDSTNTTKYNTYSNGLNALFDYDVSEKSGFEVDGSWSQKIYDGRSALDYNEVVAGIAPYYRISPKTKVGLHTGYGSRFYNENTQEVDSNWVFANVFVDYRLTGKLETRLEGGYIARQYDSLNGVDGEEWKGFNAKATLRYRPTSKWILDAGLGTRPTDSYTITDVARSKLKILTEATLGATWFVSDKLKISQGINYGFSDDKSLDLDNQQWGYKIDASYQLNKHADVSVGYSYNRVDYSKISDADYDENIVKVGFGWKF